jgi:CAAX protease family protein
MNGQPEHEPDNVQSSPVGSEPVESAEAAGGLTSHSEALLDWTPEPGLVMGVQNSQDSWESNQSESQVPMQLQEPEQPMFQQWYVPPPRPPVRIPHFGHVGILLVFVLSGLFAAGILMQVSLHFHLFGVVYLQSAMTDIHYTLGSEAIVYALMFGACLLFFPMIWHRGFFEGIQWNGGIALRLRWQLLATALISFALALINGLLLPTPKNAPIDKLFRAPGAAWLLFAFGVTFAPFFEEMVFRGFILPAMCTACDWTNEKFTHAPVRSLDDHGQPQWSFSAMVIGSIATSIPFAAMHAAQTGYSWGPFVLLVCVSLVLCWARLSTRSLAASVMVHASYNFLLFSLMMLGTSGFRHMDKL